MSTGNDQLTCQPSNTNKTCEDLKTYQGSATENQHDNSKLVDQKNLITTSHDGHINSVPITNPNLPTKSHKVEGKNKKSLHHKQQQQQMSAISNRVENKQTSNQPQSNHPRQRNSSSSSGNRRTNQKSDAQTNVNNKISKTKDAASDNKFICSNFDEFAQRADELKKDITKSLEKQANHEVIDEPTQISQLRNDILKLSLVGGDKDIDDKNESISEESPSSQPQDIPKQSSNLTTCHESRETESKSDNFTSETSSKGDIDTGKNVASRRIDTITDNNNKKTSPNDKLVEDGFAPLSAKLDSESKLIALVSSLKGRSDDSPQLLETVCRKLVNLSEENDQLSLNNENLLSENRKLHLVREKLENLCRELRKSNNEIRIESLDLIKAEQGKAKEQTNKIQSTLSGVIKLFDENQQRNRTLRQENLDLQTKLKSLVDHCDNWEKSVEVAMRQREIENRLLKTELAKSNLVRNEEKEKYLTEKQELLQILSVMQEQQHRIEGQEAKLRSDLSSYASKYDECQAVISKGMNRFQLETKRMLKQIEQSKQDYRVLLSKYESSNKRMVMLLEEKQYWDRSMNAANKKVETLEKLCRALKERKQEANKLESAGKRSDTNKNKADRHIKIKAIDVTKEQANADVNKSSEVDKIISDEADNNHVADSTNLVIVDDSSARINRENSENLESSTTQK